MKLALGPILGVEDEATYTVCIVVAKEQAVSVTAGSAGSLDRVADRFELVASVAGRRLAAVRPDRPVTNLLDHLFIRFTLVMPAEPEPDAGSQGDGVAVAGVAVDYVIHHDGEPVTTDHGSPPWTFVVPPDQGVPRIAFCSCNGAVDLHPDDPPPPGWKFWRKFWKRRPGPEMWQRLGAEHRADPFHYMVMTGDQIYADTMARKVPALAALDLGAKAVIRLDLDRAGKAEVQRQLAAYFERLYIATWSDPDIAAALASIPSVMMWDDHDIIDGWGSHPEALQGSDLMRAIYPVARTYFEIFQVRTAANSSLICSEDNKQAGRHHYSMHLKLRSVELVVLDNRSQRTRHRVMTDAQYEDVARVLTGELFDDEADEQDRLLCIVIPVPVAHLDYSALAEGLLARLSGDRFTSTLSLVDDAIDHWGHANHRIEQKRLLDLIFEAARSATRRPYHVCIVSGDVHSAGAATITDNATDDKVTQLISSGITHRAPSRWQMKTIRLASAARTVVSGYTLDLKNFGSYQKPIVRQRNFGFIEKKPGHGAVAGLCLERGLADRAEDASPAEGPTLTAYRTLNRFENADDGGRYRIPSS